MLFNLYLSVYCFVYVAVFFILTIVYFLNSSLVTSNDFATTQHKPPNSGSENIQSGNITENGEFAEYFILLMNALPRVNVIVLFRIS